VTPFKKVSPLTSEQRGDTFQKGVTSNDYNSLEMKAKLLVFGWLCLPLLAASQTAQDSLLQFLTENKTSVQQLVNNYKAVSFNWAQFLATFAGFLFLAGLTWKFWAKDKLAQYVKKKSQEAIDSMGNLKTANILVVSGEASNTAFLESFFKAKQFPNVEFQPKPGFTPHVIFANNEDGTLDKAAVRQMVKEDMVLFYFGKSGTWDFANDSPELSRKINFANSRAQIYGNLMSSLEFLELVKPKIKNV